MSDMIALYHAFDALESRGVLTRHNYWCCGGCAGGALADEYEKDPKPSVIGGVFYHEQSAESAIDGHGLMLYFDALPSTEMFGEAQRVVGEMVATELRAQGLTVEWDGDASTAIFIPRFKVTLDEIPEGTESSLHANYGEDEHYDDPWDDEDENY